MVKTFGDALLEMIERSRFGSQRQFALALGMEPTYLNRIVKGYVQRPDPETLARMGEALGVPYARMLEAAGYPRVPGNAEGREDGDGNGTPPSVPVLARDSDRLTVAEMVADIESRRGEWYQAQLRDAKTRLPRENYVSFCVDLWRMFEGNTVMAFDLLRVRRDAPPDGLA